MMRNRILAMLMASAGLMTVPAIAQEYQNQGAGQAIVTVLPKHSGEAAPNITEQDIQSLKVDGKTVKVTSWQSLRDPQSKIELVILIDDSARSSLGRQMDDIAQFVKTLPPNIKAGIAYMQNGRAVFSGPLSSDHNQVLSALRLPLGAAGVDASPYFSLSDLAKHWPSSDRDARREVVMVSDGIDYYNRRFDPEDPYVQAAITDSVRAGMVIYSIYWQNQGRLDRTMYGNYSGQNLLTELDEATGGKNLWEGFTNPVTFQPYLDEVTQRLNNQYEIGFTAPLKGKPEVATLRLKLTAPGAEVDSPQQVVVVPSAAAQM
jgi:hypothetical protein